jgi:hypothetical protein
MRESGAIKVNMVVKTRLLTRLPMWRGISKAGRVAAVRRAWIRRTNGWRMDRVREMVTPSAYNFALTHMGALHLE